ncbi:MAG: HEAT repeat domain-containing protein [Armatimonadota bacterium]|nr:HEAT repeat domain-containing protein [Armatimonadota bacterium]
MLFLVMALAGVLAWWATHSVALAAYPVAFYAWTIGGFRKHFVDRLLEPVSQWTRFLGSVAWPVCSVPILVITFNRTHNWLWSVVAGIVGACLVLDAVFLPVVYRRTRFSSSKALGHLLQAMNSEDSILRVFAATALGQIGGPDAVARLVLALEDGDPFVRSMAAEALGIIGDAAALPALQERLPAATPGGETAYFEEAIEKLSNEPKVCMDPAAERRPHNVTVRPLYIILAMLGAIVSGRNLGGWIKANPTSTLGLVHPIWLGFAIVAFGLVLPNLYRPFISSQRRAGNPSGANATAELACAAGLYVMFLMPSVWNVLLGTVWMVIGAVIVCIVLGAISKTFKRAGQG